MLALLVFGLGIPETEMKQLFVTYDEKVTINVLNTLKNDKGVRFICFHWLKHFKEFCFGNSVKNVCKHCILALLLC